MIKREQYINKLINLKDKKLIKVITGIRRCGKSTLLEQFQEYLLNNGVEEEQIIAINFEDPDYKNLKNSGNLYEYIKNKLIKGKKNYIFLDEIQNVENFEIAVDGLYIKKNVDIYITGSNAYLLSSELATLLTGRYIEIKMYPLSFKEYISYYEKEADEKLYLNYINRSSFPYALKLDGESEIDDYLDALYNTIILKDVAQRRKIADTSMLRTVAKFMFDNIGNCLSIKKISDTLTSDGRPISVHTVESYLDALVECYVFNKVSRFDVKGKQYLQSGEKYYATDVTMRYALLGRRNIDIGHILENVVYLELIRRGYKVYIGKTGEKEIDFVAENKDGFTYFQVAYTTREKTTLERELIPLQEINDHYPKYILTMDIDPITDYNGIKKINVLDWLLGN